MAYVMGWGRVDTGTIQRSFNWPAPGSAFPCLPNAKQVLQRAILQRRPQVFFLPEQVEWWAPLAGLGPWMVP
ncbi:hypothetical protein IAQ61_008848 [Plenodomus lingam]|uniref:uncharacterized protein n=1 Tax=Leptosphaeria maculans TaxID=5022 RepID=UPI0033184BDB|nr:hypothetical protein IAQ61_008848 [Plenodomus lingam]